MKKLPILLSVPHAGYQVPPEAAAYSRLTADEIVADGDEGAADVYDLKEHVTGFVTTEIARAIVDVNRAEDDRSPDGVVKTATCWLVPVYSTFPPPSVVETLLERYYRPYHARLAALAETACLGVDCHTMAAVGPPVGPDPGAERPRVCLADGDGVTLPSRWMSALVACFTEAFGEAAAANQPFRGGYIIRAHHHEMPWVQLELSRPGFLSNEEKRTRVLRALQEFCSNIPSNPG